MRFGKTLRKSIYPPWADKYIEYDKLKKILRDDESTAGSTNDDDKWTEEDEGAFVEELVNVQLEKVHAFHSETYQKLRDRTAACEAKLNSLGQGRVGDSNGDSNGEDGAEEKKEEEDEKQEGRNEDREATLKEVLQELDSISREVNELERYARINYTGFLKAAKKHDRKRGHDYRVRPLLQVRLAALPFNKEDYSPLLYRLSGMYSFVRQNLERDKARPRELSFSDSQAGGEGFTSHKFWVHPENLLEVKTVILRRLPVLVYNPQTSKIAEGTQKDPTITSIYFDNPGFSLYDDKVNHRPDASSLRLRWYGQLADKTEIFFEKKTMKEGDASEEQRFPIKEKYIQPFIRGDYKMEKSIQKLQDRSGDQGARAEQLQKSVESIQSFIRDNDLQPMVRANYTRTAFQIPGDDRVRISLDTELALIREDAIDKDRPCRDPDDWHRKDIDDAQLEYPFSSIRKGEINRFPFALLEIKIKGRKTYEWVSDLTSSHLVKEAPRFSKFVHGVALLFEDYVNSFPFWLSQLETDIRRDPHEAFEEEQERKARMAEDEVAVGSLFGVGSKESPSAFKHGVSSPVGSLDRPPHSASIDRLQRRATVDMTRRASQAYVGEASGKEAVVDEEDSDDDGQQANRDAANMTMSTSGFRSLFPRSRPQRPVKVEAKVWLANQRTFIKWQHVSVLLASLSLGLYNAAGETNGVARSLAVYRAAMQKRSRQNEGAVNATYPYGYGLGEL
ncbi:Phosphate metabolism transcription protein [Coniosporium tulheliwenetii]|uniref:Phosphate metabolism transcription protein n=1 Tax=Coniosporium tulheliwenetii TaxID=3383036 RepID=A0ACC2Z2S5_9PEZI|nr:Phosphate metabolism transcription protein [Cladosporium sp. JES 115]